MLAMYFSKPLRMGWCCCTCYMSAIYFFSQPLRMGWLVVPFHQYMEVSLYTELCILSVYRYRYASVQSYFCEVAIIYSAFLMHGHDSQLPGGPMLIYVCFWHVFNV